MKVKLVEDWKQCWRWASTRFAVLAGALATVWIASPELQAMLPADWVARISPVLAVVAIVLRVTKKVKK